MCQTIYQIKGNVQRYNKSHANILLSVTILTYGQKYYDIPKSRHLKNKLKFVKPVFNILVLGKKVTKTLSNVIH